MTGLSKTLDEETLFGMFEDIGPIISKRLFFHKKTGLATHAAIQFASVKDANNAKLRLDGKLIDGIPLSVTNFMYKDERAQAQVKQSFGGPAINSADLSQLLFQMENLMMR